MRMTTFAWGVVGATVAISTLGGCSSKEEPVGSVTSEVTSIDLEPAECPDNLGSCTANDVVTTVVDANEIDDDDCADGYLDVEWTFQFATTANERYDLGVFIATDGVTPQESLSCVGAAPQAGDGDGATDPDGDDDFFLDIDPHGGEDTCGDLSATEGPVQLTVSATVACVDVTDTGELTVQSCRVWQHNANHRDPCTDLTSAGTGSKCDCDPIVLHVDPCSLIICDDGLFCNGQETCDSSSGVAECESGTAPDCDDGVACTIDACDEDADACTNTPSNAYCDDGLYCNGTETCDPANDCQAGTSVVCGDAYTCTTDVCNEATDACESTDNGSCSLLPPAGSGCVCTCIPTP